MEEQLVDYLAGELDERSAGEVRRAIAESAEWQAELEELLLLRRAVRAQPGEAPSERLHLRFQAALAVEKQRMRQARLRRLTLSWAAAASVLILIGVGIGLQMRPAAATEAEGLRAELAATRQLMLHLMEQPQTSSRMKAAHVALDLPQIDADIVQNLSFMLHNDVSSNVRLAAIDALLQFGNDPLVRQTLLDALEHEQPMVVQLALIQALVDLEQTEAVPLLEKWIEDGSLQRQVREEARLARFKLT